MAAAVSGTFHQTSRSRVTALAAAIGLQLALGWLLLLGLRADLPARIEASLQLFDVVAVPPPVPPVRPRVIGHRARHAAAPPNRRATATPIVAPPVIVPPVVLPPLVAAPVAGTGSDSAQGAADPGPGSGAGGAGNGTGGGGNGDGGDGAHAYWRSGAIRDSDYPREALAAHIEGTVYVRLAISAKGRVTDCQIRRSSGSALLDATSCRLIRQRFRYEPARDGAGRAIPDVVGGEDHWEITHRDTPPEANRDAP